MGFKAIDWYCQPEANGVWAKAASAFGSYTPCAMDSMVICISHLVVLGLCCYQVWMIKKNLKARRFRLKSNYFNYLLGLLAAYFTAEPLLRLVMGLSLFNPVGRNGFAPFEINSSIIEALAWCSMLILIALETKIYIGEFRWYVRFGVLYVLVGNAVVLNLILEVTVTVAYAFARVASTRGTFARGGSIRVTSTQPSRRASMVIQVQVTVDSFGEA